MSERRLDLLACAAVVVAIVLLAPVLAQAQPVPGDAASGERLDRVLPGSRADVPPTLEQWVRGLEPDLQRAVVVRIRQMPERRRARFFRRWRNLDDRERRVLQDRLETRATERLAAARSRHRGQAMQEHWRGLSPEQRRDFRKQAQRWNEMSGPERRRMRRRLDAFSRLSPEDQVRLIDRTFPDASEEARARQLDRLRAAAAAQQARQQDRAR